MPRWMRVLFLQWTARVVLLKKTVERSCPKPKFKTSTRRRKPEMECKDHEEARENGAVVHEQMMHGSLPDQFERKDDHLVAELKRMFMISKNLDHGGLRYANSVKSAHLNVVTDGQDTYCPEPYEAWDETSLSFTGVLDENGEELNENELNLRRWEWIMAARVLDRALLWVSIISGIVTFFAIFVRAPRLQEILLGS